MNENKSKQKLTLAASSATRKQSIIGAAGGRGCVRPECPSVTGRYARHARSIMILILVLLYTLPMFHRLLPRLFMGIYVWNSHESARVG